MSQEGSETSRYWERTDANLGLGETEVILKLNIKLVTADIASSMIGLTVHTEAALLHSTQLLQLLVQDIHCLLHTLPLGHRHLADTAEHRTPHVKNGGYICDPRRRAGCTFYLKVCNITEQLCFLVIARRKLTYHFNNKITIHEKKYPRLYYSLLLYYS